MPSSVKIRSAPPAPPRPRVAPHKPRSLPQTAPPALEPPWHVILLDDDFHSHAYVIEMLHTIFGHSLELGALMAEEVNDQGRVIVVTVHKELAELRKQQIEEYGPDAGEQSDEGQISMRAEIEPSA